MPPMSEERRASAQPPCDRRLIGDRPFWRHGLPYERTNWSDTLPPRWIFRHGPAGHFSTSTACSCRRIAGAVGSARSCWQRCAPMRRRREYRKSNGRRPRGMKTPSASIVAREHRCCLKRASRFQRPEGGIVSKHDPLRDRVPCRLPPISTCSPGTSAPIFHATGGNQDNRRLQVPNQPLLWPINPIG